MLNELDTIKARADQMGIKYKSNIGLVALKAKINAHLDGQPDPGDGEDGETAIQQDPVVTKELTPAQQAQAFREQMATEQMALVRVRITCLNPLKREIKGEIITVANKHLGTVRKMVPFGEQTDEGFHIPRVLLTELQARKFNSVTTKKGPNGQRLPVSRLVPEFAIEILPPLTEDELAELAAAQAAAQGG